MANRFASATAAILMVATGTGCSSGWDAVGRHVLNVRINGADAGAHAVECSQVQWLWNIKTLEETPGVIAQVNTEDAADARSVQINNLGGFTGSFWDGTTGDAEAQLVNGTFTITGTAEGYFHDNPGERTSTTFEITTDC